MRRLVRNRAGNVTMLLAGALSMLAATAGLGVDAGMMLLERRRLQGLADAAALAAAASPDHATAAAQAALDLAGGRPVRLAAVTPGHYQPDPAAPTDRRFVAGAGSDAVRVRVTAQVSPVFMRALGVRDAVDVAADATAARIALAGFSIGSRVAAVANGLPGQLLSALAGTDLRLSLVDHQALLGGRVDLLRFLDALRRELRLPGATYAQVLAAATTQPVVLRAAAEAASDAATRQALLTLSARARVLPLSLAGLIDLGALGEGLTPGAAPPLSVEAHALVRNIFEGDAARTVDVTLGTALPGVAGARVRLALGERASGSPWLAVDAVHGATVRTRQARLRVEVTLAEALAGIAALRLPIVVELAPATATLTSVTCARGRAETAATLSVTPSLGKLILADNDAAAFDDFSRDLVLRPAELLRAPLISVTARADAALGARARPVTFDAAAIAAATPQTSSSDDIAQALVASLVERATIEGRVLGLGLTLAPVLAAVRPALTAVAPHVDTLLMQVAGLAGMGVGQADTWVNGVRCSTPVLVK